MYCRTSPLLRRCCCCCYRRCCCYYCCCPAAVVVAEWLLPLLTKTKMLWSARRRRGRRKTGSRTAVIPRPRISVWICLFLGPCAVGSMATVERSNTFLRQVCRNLYVLLPRNHKISSYCLGRRIQRLLPKGNCCLLAGPWPGNPFWNSLTSENGDILAIWTVSSHFGLSAIK